jgi:hypothetical protein
VGDRGFARGQADAWVPGPVHEDGGDHASCEPREKGGFEGRAADRRASELRAGQIGDEAARDARRAARCSTAPSLPGPPGRQAKPQAGSRGRGARRSPSASEGDHQALFPENLGRSCGGGREGATRRGCKLRGLR